MLYHIAELLVLLLSWADYTRGRLLLLGLASFINGFTLPASYPSKDRDGSFCRVSKKQMGRSALFHSSGALSLLSFLDRF